MTRRLLIPLLLWLLAAPPAGAQATAFPDSMISVAVYSSKRTLLTEYPIDSIVVHLNRFCRIPGLRFFICTEDDTRTGFYADHLVDIDLSIREPHISTSHYERVPVQRAVSRRMRTAGGTWEDVIQYVTAYEQRYVNGTPQPGSATAQFKFTGRRDNQKVVRNWFTVQEDALPDLKVSLMLRLMRTMIAHFEKYDDFGLSRPQQ